jgi:hypothetical protein
MSYLPLSVRWFLPVGASVATPVAAQSPTSYLCEVNNIYELSLSGEVVQSFGSTGRSGDHFQINADHFSK